MSKIKNFRIYSNNNERSKEIENLVKYKLNKEGFKESNNCDLSIAIGGDGSLI